MEYKGISLTLDMDTSKFESAVNRVKNSANALNKDISYLKNAFKFDPSNIQTFTSYTNKLRQQLGELEEESVFLRNALSQATPDTRQWNVLQSALADVDKKIEKVNKELDEANYTFGEFNTEVNYSVDNLQELEDTLEQQEKELDDNSKKWKKLGDDIKDSSKDVEEHKSIWQEAGAKATLFFENLKANLVSNIITSGLNLIKNAITSVVNGLKNLAKGYIDLMKQGIEYNSKLQDSTKSLGIILDGDEKRAANVINKLKVASAQLGVDIEPLVEGTQQLTIAGVGVEDAATAILGMSKALKLVGADAGALQLVITNLMQLQTQGGATARDLREFATKGIPIYKLLADYSKRFAKGNYEAKDVKFEDVVGAMLKAINDPNSPFSKSEEIVANTFTGQFDTIRVRWQQLLGNMAEDTTSILTTSLFPSVSGLLEKMIDAYNNPKSVIDTETRKKMLKLSQEEGIPYVEDQWEAVKIAFAEGLNEVINVLFDPETINAFLGGIETIISAIEAAFDPSTPEGEKNRTTLSSAIDKLITMLDGIIKTITPQLIAIGNSIGGAIFDGIRDALKNALLNYFQQILWNDIREAFPGGMFLLPNEPIWKNWGNNTPNANSFDSASFRQPQNSNNLTSNLTIHIQNGNNITDETVEGWAKIINKKLGEDLG